MSKRRNQILFAIILGGVIPAMLFSYLGKRYQKAPAQLQIPTEQLQQTDVPAPTAPIEPEDTVFSIRVLMDDGTVSEMMLDTYLLSVVLQEMPADFEMEALKAQAVVARTYTLQKLAGGKHAQAAVCTDASCCQGYCTVNAYLEKGGTQEHVKKVENAVLGTKDLVLTYNGQLIEATYFSCSGGRTEDAQAVWGTDVPYLQSIESPGEETADHYTDTVTFSAEEFSNLLGGLTGHPGTWLQGVTYTQGGGVEKMTICGEDYKGTQLRQLLGLRSTAFVMTAVGDTVVITTKGYGHRVGMSQYGADAMAVSGSNFEQILTHYYQGAQLEQYDLSD